MKNITIKYTEKYYCMVLNIFYLLFFLMILFITIEKEIYVLIPILLIFILCFIVLFIIFANYNIVFNYNDKIIKVLEPGHFSSIKIKMSDIKMIKFYEAKSERKRNKMFYKVRLLYNFEPTYVYNKGKKYFIEIMKENGQNIKISYNSLYKCKKENTIILFENKINEIIKEFNEFKHKNYFKK